VQVWNAPLLRGSPIAVWATFPVRHLGETISYGSRPAARSVRAHVASIGEQLTNSLQKWADENCHLGQV
jgi:hypothetical protein